MLAESPREVLLSSSSLSLPSFFLHGWPLRQELTALEDGNAGRWSSKSSWLGKEVEVSKDQGRGGDQQGERVEGGGQQERKGER